MHQSAGNVDVAFQKQIRDNDLGAIKMKITQKDMEVSEVAKGEIRVTKSSVTGVNGY